MDSIKVTITPEQQAAMRERLTDVWAPFTAQILAIAPAAAKAAKDISKSARHVAARP